MDFYINNSTFVIYIYWTKAKICIFINQCEYIIEQFAYIHNIAYVYSVIIDNNRSTIYCVIIIFLNMQTFISIYVYIYKGHMSIHCTWCTNLVIPLSNHICIPNTLLTTLL